MDQSLPGKATIIAALGIIPRLKDLRKGLEAVLGNGRIRGASSWLFLIVFGTLSIAALGLKTTTFYIEAACYAIYCIRKNAARWHDGGNPLGFKCLAEFVA